MCAKYASVLKIEDQKYKVKIEGEGRGIIIFRLWAFQVVNVEYVVVQCYV